MVKVKQCRIGPWKWSRTPWMLTWTLLLMCTFLIVILLALGILSIPSANSFHHLSKPHLPNFSRAHNIHISKNKDDWRDQWVEIISREPRAYLYHNFLTTEECEYLINLAKPNMTKSLVVDHETGKIIESRERTSMGTFLTRGQDQIVMNIEKRIAEFSFIPVEHGEGLHVIHYEVGQKYEPHFDFFWDKFSTLNGGQRIATMLMYLSNVEEGGETMFPNAKKNFNFVPRWNELSNCGKQGLSIKPKMGDALLFWNMKPDGTLDLRSIHGACPVIKGHKWTCAKWMRARKHYTSRKN